MHCAINRIFLLYSLLITSACFLHYSKDFLKSSIHSCNKKQIQQKPYHKLAVFFPPFPSHISCRILCCCCCCCLNGMTNQIVRISYLILLRCCRSFRIYMYYESVLVWVCVLENRSHLNSMSSFVFINYYPIFMDLYWYNVYVWNLVCDMNSIVMSVITHFLFLFLLCLVFIFLPFLLY